MFATITKTLTTQQQNYLKILIAGEKAISSMSDTSLSNLFNDLNIPLKGCSYQECMDNKAGEISFQNPIYAHWLKTE